MLLLALALPMQGDLKVAVEAAVVAAPGGRSLELYCELPRSSLVFVRSDGGFAARYQVRVQATGRRRGALAARVWEREEHLTDFAQTSRGDSTLSATFSLVLPESAVGASVEVRDMSSERRASGRLEFPPGGDGLSLVFDGGSTGAGNRRLGFSDTLRVRAVTAAGIKMDSCRFLVKTGGKVVTGATVAAGDSAEVSSAAFAHPVAGTPGRPKLRIGDHELVANGLASGRLLSAVATFRVDYPFYYDDSLYEVRVEQLVYVASTEEIRRLKGADLPERDSTWRAFWRSRDDVPATERNEREDEYFSRIAYAEEKFRHGDRGFRSDRGRVYVTYGPPDQVDSRTFELDSPAYEVWHYYGNGRTFTFVDRYGTGQFVLAGARG